MFKKTLAAGLLILANIAYAEIITIPDSSVTFDSPAGFTSLKKEEIATKFPRGNPPSYVVGNERRSTTIAYDLKNQNVPDSELNTVLQGFETLFTRVIPGIQWKKKEIVTIQGKRWIFLEMTSSAIDTDIYNIMLVTPHDGKLLMFNFNSTKEDFPKVEVALRKSIKTISLGSK